MIKHLRLPAITRALSCALAAMSLHTAAQEATPNPIIWADVPDVALIRVDDTYYMSSTTMHMSPGLPIMQSSNLVDWQLVDYAYDRLIENDAMNLNGDQSTYGRGSWASSFRYHNNQFYVSTFSATSGKTHIYQNSEVSKGDWRENSFPPSLHDHSMFFEDDRAFLVYGSGDIRLLELNSDLSGIKPGGINKVIINNASSVAGDDIMLPAEGAQLRKINGYYYLLTITWPRNGMRTVLVHRSKNLEGPYQGKVALQHQGIAQGSLIDTPDGKWYAMLFGDRGAVGRIPYLVPVQWQDDWPVLGIEGKVPMQLDIAPSDNSRLGNIVTSDEFSSPTLPLAWQWNHNPDNDNWSLTDRPGFLRLTNPRLDRGFLATQNTLTQRTFGPTSAASIKLEFDNMKAGDVAGLGLLQKHFGYIAVRKKESGTELIAVQATDDDVKEKESEVLASVPITQSHVYLKIDADFTDKNDTANFYYSFDNTHWNKLGSALKMRYTLPHFMGYRFALFNFAQKHAGGFVDFDYYRLAPPKAYSQGPKL